MGRKKGKPNVYLQTNKYADDPILNLALAVVAISVADYRRAIRKGEDLTTYRKFFNSSWFCVLTRDKLDGEVLGYEIERREKERILREQREKATKKEQGTTDVGSTGEGRCDTEPINLVAEK